MGWLFTLGASRREIIAEVTQGWENNGVRTECLAKCASGNHLWTVWEQTKDGGESERFICLFILDRGRGDGWGYKDVTESMGPTAVSCPLKYLDMVPDVPEPYGAEWRERVRAYWARRRARRQSTRRLWA